MQEIRIMIGVPSSGKSFYCRELMTNEPGRWKRLNNDALREAVDFSVYSKENEKLIGELRSHMLREFLKAGCNVLIDNVNSPKNERHWNETLKTAQQMNKDIALQEVPFYCPLEELLARDSKRIGTAQVGEKIIRKWFKELGGEDFKNYEPRKEVLVQNGNVKDSPWEPLKQDESLQRAIIFDNDGTICRIHSGRSPYEAASCNLDLPQDHTIEVLRLYHKAGYKILFVSGRETKYREPTEQFYKQHFPEVSYELFTRKDGDFRKDVIIKEEIFNEHIKGKYFIAGWYDDRLQVSRWVHQMGLPLFRVGDPEANF